MPEACDTIRSVFEEAQRGFQHHAKLIRALKKIQESSSSEEEFRESFIEHLAHAMIVFKREPAVERIVEFVAKYSTAKIHYTVEERNTDDLSGDEGQEGETSHFLRFVFVFLLDCHEAKDKAVRFRTCQLINKLLNNMDDEASIEDDIADKIFDCMLVRLRDKIPAIRVQAVQALARLQDPADDDCQVISSYLQRLATDSSADVRRAVLVNIALSRKTLPEIIERTHDVTESVRKLAYRIIAEKTKIQWLSIAQRVQILHDGLNDRAQSVKDICIKTLLHGWQKSYEGNIVELLKCLDIENSPDTAEMAVMALLKGLSKEELKQQINALKSDPNQTGPVKFSYEQLDCEMAFYWRCLGQHVKSLGVEGEELLDDLLPEVSSFCEYIQGYIDNHFTSPPEITSKALQETFVATQVLLLAGVMDLADEVGRKRLSQLVHDLLVSPNIPDLLVGVLHSRLADVESDEDARIQQLVEVIADVQQPMVMVETAASKEEARQKELELAAIKVKLLQYKDEMEECVSGQNFTKAAELKETITELEEERTNLLEESASTSLPVREEKDDPATLLKCLTISCEMLEATTRRGLNPTLTTLVDTLVLPGVQNEDPQVRHAAVKCLGLGALLSCEFARKHLVLFLQVAQLDQELVQVTALRVVFDLLQKFGLEAFKLNPTNEILNADTSSSSAPEAEKETEEEEGSSEELAEEREEGGGEGDANAPDNTAASVLSILTGLLESESNDLRNVAAEGLAKLLLSGRVLSAKLLSRLILLWYNPTTEEDGHLRHCIGVFLPVFAFASRTNQELVEESFLPTLRTLFSAPDSSPLAAINYNNVAELLVELTNNKHLNNMSATKNSTDTTEGCSHVSLALKVANEILSDPEAPGVRVLCKILSVLDIAGCDLTSVRDLKVLVNQMMQGIEEGASVKLLDKFQRSLDLMEIAAGDDSASGNSEESADKTSNEGEEGGGSQETESTGAEAEEDTADGVDTTVPGNGTSHGMSSTVQNDTTEGPDAAVTSDSTTTSLPGNGTTDGISRTVQEENQEVLEEGSAGNKDTAEISGNQGTLPSKTPKSKASKSRTKKKTSQASGKTTSVSESMSTRKTRSTRRSRNTSTVKAKLDLSDSDATSDKENAVF